MSLRSISVLLITFILTIGASASTNISMPGPLDKISNLSINFVEPNEDFIRSYNNEIVNTDDTVIISLIFREIIESNPKFSYSIYRATLTRLKDISEQDYLANKTALEHLMYNTLKNLESGVSKTASIDVEQSESLTCLCAGEGSCGDGAEAEQCNADIDPGLTPVIAAGGLVYASQSNGNTQRYAGVSSTYNSDLAATWAAREEFDVVNLARDMSITLNDTFGRENTSWSRVAGNNPYEQLNVHKAYGYGLSGDGVKVGLMDDSLCYNVSTTSLTHLDLQAKQTAGKIETFGSYTESYWNYYNNNEDYDIATHGCHVATTIAGDYNDNAIDNTGEIGKENGDYGHWNPYTTGGWFSTTHNMERGMMGVAYNSSIHFSDFGGDGTACSGDDDTDCGGVQGWELAFEDAKSKGVKVHNNSWGYLGDTTPEQILAASGTTNADKIATYANANFSLNYTGTQVQEFVDALDSFQDTGVIVWATSNDSTNTMSTVVGSTNKSNISTSMPQLFPELQDAWISVVNVGTRTDGTKKLYSAACAGNAAWCVSHDGFNITAGSLRSESSKDGGSGWFGSWYETSTGTSMASPQVTGAIALLWEAFPDNSPSVIQKRLIMTADNSWLTTDTCYLLSENDYDNSCGGIDGTVTWNGVSHSYNNIYGHGNPDLYEALQPIGTKSVSFGNQAYALIGTGLLIANTYGDSLSMVGETGLYRDQLHGGFTFNLSDLVERNTRNEIHRKLQNGTHSVWSPVSHDQGLNFSYSHEADINNNGLVDDSGFYSSFVSGKNTIYVGQKYSADQALGLRDGNNAMSVLTAHNSNESFLSFTESASSGNLIGSKIDLDNSLSFNVMAYSGVHSDYDLKEKGFLASLKHKSTSNSDFSIFIGQNNEMEGLLRTSGEGAFGNFAGETYHLGTTFNKQIANNVHLAGLFNYGLVTSSSDNAGFLSDVSDLQTSQFNVGMVVSGLSRSNNLISLNLSQPLRVESGFTNLNIPGRLDQNGNVTHTTKRLSLEPSGRELNLDLGYEMKLFNGAIKVGSQLMFDAVHMESNNSETVYGIFKTSF